MKPYASTINEVTRLSDLESEAIENLSAEDLAAVHGGSGAEAAIPAPVLVAAGVVAYWLLDRAGTAADEVIKHEIAEAYREQPTPPPEPTPPPAPHTPPPAADTGGSQGGQSFPDGSSVGGHSFQPTSSNEANSSY